MSAVIEPSTQKTALTAQFNGQFLNLRPITVAEYDLMIESGVFDENDELELVNGAIVKKMTKGTKHSAINDRITRLFYKTLDDSVIIRNQNPIWLDEISEPEPDVVLARFRDDEYENTHPVPEEIFLIVEVADTTLEYDRNTKCAAYARAGIVQFILLNVKEQTLEDYREPFGESYQSKQTHRIGQSFDLAAFPEIRLSVNDFFPR